MPSVYTLILCPFISTSSPSGTKYFSSLADYCIVVIERPGYGFSDEVEGVPALDTILNWEREALSKLEIDGPYILIPHSASGIEAILWAQLYPDEVEAIIGLDMSVPAYYEKNV